MPQIACQWRTKILFSPGKDQALTVVDSWPPSALASEDKAELQPLIDDVTTANATEISTMLAAMSTIVRAPFDKNSSWMQIADIIFGDINPG